MLIAAALPPASAQPSLPDLDGEAPLPDLIASNLAISPERPHIHGDSRFCTDVRNLGETEAASRFEVSFVLDGQVEAAERTTEGLRAGHAVTICHVFNFTESALGRHRWTVRVDTDGGENGEVLEKDETNNEFSPEKSFEVTDEPRPNLRIVEWGVTPRTSGTSNSQFFYIEIANNGRLASTATYADIVLDSTDNRTRLRFPVAAMQPGQSVNVGRLIPTENRASGDFVADFIVDPDDQVRESREHYDNVASMLYTVSPHPLPDLALTDVVVQGEYREHRTLRVDARVTNVGNLTPRATTVATLLAENETGVVRILSNQTVPRLPVGHGENLTYVFTLAPGNHTLRLVADPDARIAELSEENNHWSVNVTIAAAPVPVKQPDLRVVRIDASPDDPRPDEVVTVLALVENAGNADATDVEVAIYVGGERIVLGSAPTIEPGLSATVVGTWAPGEPGDYELRAEADPRNVVVEIAEEDNNLTRLFTLRASEAAEPPPTTTPPTTTTPPPTGTTEPPPAQETPEDETPENETLEPVAIAQVAITLRSEPGKLIGRIGIALRNPNLEPLPGMSVTYLVDGQKVREQLVSGGLAAAATRSFVAGDTELPPGKHTLRVDVRYLGSTEIVASTTEEYEGEAGETGVPAPGLAIVLALAAAVAAARRRRR